MAEAKWSGVLSTTEPRNDVGIIKVRQGNINSEIVEFQIVQNNKPYDLTGLTVYFCASFGLNLVEKPAVVVNTTGGKIQYTFDDDSMQSVGRQKGYFSIKKAESKIDSTQEFEFQVESSLMTRSIDGKSYIYKLSTLIKVLDDFIKNGQNNFNTWFDSVKEILYGVDPGGNILRELIEARKNSSGNIFASLKARLDKNEDDTAEQFAQNSNKFNNMPSINVKDFGAAGDGITDDTTSIQKAFDYAKTLYEGDKTEDTGYLGWFFPEIEFPQGVYICGLVTSPPAFKLKGVGKAVIKSVVGSKENHNGKFIDNRIHNMTVEKLGFLFYDTVFVTPTNNADFSFITFDGCHVSENNKLIDTVSYELSRSTHFLMRKCVVTYGVETLVSIYTDKAHFEGNWFIHSSNNIFMKIDSHATFKDNIYIPVNPGLKKAYFEFNGSDYTRGLHFIGERFGGEDGSCPIVIVKKTNEDNINEAYRQEGIKFDTCLITSNSEYNPNALNPIRAVVVLEGQDTGLNTINFIEFNSCALAPDLSGGIVQTYGVNTFNPPDDFIIKFDEVSAISGTKGVNKLTSSNLLDYVSTPLISRKTKGIRKGSGKVAVKNATTTGIKKGTFSLDFSLTSYLAPFTFLVTCIGKGDANFNSLEYSYTSTYILTVSGENSTSTHAKINFTKLHSTVGGSSMSCNADIISAHFGSLDTGGTEKTFSSEVKFQDLSIVFGKGIMEGGLYVKPLYDFSLLT